MKGLPDTPTKRGKEREAIVASTPATTSLDDLRTLINIITQDDAANFVNDTFKPTITRSSSNKAALKVIFSSTAAVQSEELNTVTATSAVIVPTPPQTTVVSEDGFFASPLPIEATKVANGTVTVSLLDPTWPQIGLFITNAISDKEVEELFNYEDQEKITQLVCWNLTDWTAHFKTLDERDAAFSNLLVKINSLQTSGADATSQVKQARSEIVGLFILNVSLDEAVEKFFKDEDRAKITKVTWWGQDKKVAHFNTMKERDSIFASLPEKVKVRSGEDRRKLLVKIFQKRERKVSVVSNASPSEASEAPVDDSTTSATLSILQEPSFALFGKLNKKLRKRIWEFVRPDARIIKLSISGNTIYSTAPVPVLLQVCRESRKLALGWYQLSFAGEGQSIGKVYFDFSRDGVYTRCRGCLGPNCLHKKTWSKDHEKVKLVAFESPMSFKPIRKIARLYPGVEELILIKGKSIIPRGQIALEEFEKVEEHFAWQGCENDVVVLYSRELEVKEPQLAKELKLKKVTRMTLPGVIETAEPTSNTGQGMWTCCL